MIRFTSDTLVPGGTILISWTRQPDDHFLIVLAHYEPMMIKKVLVDVIYAADGLSQPFPVSLPQIPILDGYILQATNISNLNEIWDQSEAFSISDPTSIPTSTTNGPVTVYTTTTITATSSTSLSSSSSSAITTPLSPMSQSTSTPSSFSPTTSVSSTSSVPDTVTYSPTPSQVSDSEKSIPLGSIIGGTIGGLFLILLLIFALVFFRMRSRKKRSTDHEDFFVDPKVHAASMVTPFPVVSPSHNLTLDNSFPRSHRISPSITESYDHSKPMTYGSDYAMDSIPRALTPGSTSHTSQSLQSQTGLQPPKSSMHETTSIGGTSTVFSQPFTNSTGRPSTPNIPFTGSRPAQHSPHIPVQQSPVSLSPESATVVPGTSTGTSSNASQRRPLLVVGGTSCGIDDDELPPPSYSSGILVASVREK